jgi:hypothetical protein
MDGAQEVERNHAARAVSAKVHTRGWECVSFGEPGERAHSALWVAPGVGKNAGKDAGATGRTGELGVS